MHDTDDIEAVMRYHERTKHHFDRYAPGPGELDWANLPGLGHGIDRRVVDAVIRRLGGAAPTPI